MSAEKSPPASDTADREIKTTRVVPASRERLFAAFSDPDQLERWWGPKDFTCTIREFDLRADGTRITWVLLFDSTAECARIRGIVTEANEQNLDRLENHLASFH